MTGLCQLTLQKREDQTTAWNINDPRACIIHKKLAEMIAIDSQPVSIVEDVGFINFVKTLEPCYNRGIGIGPAGPVLARPLFLKVKTKFRFIKTK